MTGADLVKGALSFVGAWSPADGDVPGADSERALFWANLLRSSWNTNGLAIAVTVRSTYVWAANQAARTIGAAGQLVGTKPERVLFAKLIPVGATAEQDVDVLTHARYAGIPDKTQTADVFRDLLYENTGVSTGTLTVWPVPTTAPTLVLHHQGQYASFTLADALTLPEGAEPAFVIDLAKLVAPVFGRPWTREQEETHRTLTGIWKASTIRVPDEVAMPAGVPGTSRGGMTKATYDGGRF